MENNEVTTKPKRKINRKVILDFMKLHKFELAAYLGFVLCLIVFSILPPIINGVSIWDKVPFKNFMKKITPLLIVGIGATFIYSMGAIDISVGYQTAVYGAIFVVILNSTGSIFLAFGTIVIIGILCAVFNATIGAYVKLPAVMSSVILMQLFSGISTLIQDKFGGTSVDITNPDTAARFTWTENQFLVILVIIVLCVVASYILKYTKIGKRARAIGANKLAANQAGAKLLITRMSCYAVFSVFLCVCAFFLIGRSKSMPLAATENFQMDIMIMLLMGGVPLKGGMRVKLSGSIVGCITYNLISTGMSYCSVPPSLILITQAVIFLVIVSMTCRTNEEYLPR